MILESSGDLSRNNKEGEGGYELIVRDLARLCTGPQARPAQSAATARAPCEERDLVPLAFLALLVLDVVDGIAALAWRQVL